MGRPPPALPRQSPRQEQTRTHPQSAGACASLGPRTAGDSPMHSSAPPGGRGFPALGRCVSVVFLVGCSVSDPVTSVRPTTGNTACRFVSRRGHTAVVLGHSRPRIKRWGPLGSPKAPRACLRHRWGVESWGSRRRRGHLRRRPSVPGLGASTSLDSVSGHWPRGRQAGSPGRGAQRTESLQLCLARGAERP